MAFWFRNIVTAYGPLMLWQPKILSAISTWSNGRALQFEISLRTLAGSELIGEVVTLFF